MCLDMVTPKLRVELISSPEHVEILRNIRNASAGTYSNDNTHISQERQLAWWESTKNRLMGWLYIQVHSPYDSIGFGIVRLSDDGNWWNSIGVSPSFKGQGYGSFITHDILSRYNGRIYAAVRRDNIPGIRMHHDDDWQRIDGPESVRLIYFRSRQG